jgi:hypothetical protein
MLREAIKAILPVPTRRAVRQFLDERALTASLQPIRRGDFSHDALGAFRRAWGNDGFSGDIRFLEECAARLSAPRGTVLECGTGATTILAGVLAERYGFDVFCLEQDPEWAAKARNTLKREKLTRVGVLDAPLTRYGDYVWYDVKGHALPDDITLVICDGPFVGKEVDEEAYASWRYGIMPYLRGRQFGTMLLDDCDEYRARPVLERWRIEFGVKIEVVTSATGDFGVITRH